MYSASVLVLSLLCYVNTLDLPTEFPKCKRSDPLINSCLQNSMQTILPLLAKGVPSLGIPECDPIRIPSLTIGEGKGVVHVVQKFKNLELHDIITAKIENVISVFTDEEMQINATVRFKELNMVADYNLNGRILVLPIFGEGKCTLKLVNPSVPVSIVGKPFKKKDKLYINVTDFEMNIAPKNIVFNFENLFNGDPRMGPQMNTILNDNAFDVFLDVKKSYEEAFGIIFKHITNAIFTRVPFDVLLPP